MKGTRGPLLCLLACGTLCLAALGCNSKKVNVHGKLTLGGKPLQGTERAKITVHFCTVQEEADKPAKVYVAEVNQDQGTYEVTVPAGKYRIAVTHYQADLSDRFRNAFSQSSSPIVRELTNDEEIDLDLSKPTG